MKRLIHAVRVGMVPLVVALAVGIAVPATPAAAVDPGSGTTALTGSGTVSPGINPTDTSGTSQTYDITAAMTGVAEGVPFTANCTFTGASTGPETVAQGQANLTGTCAGSSPLGGTVSIRCQTAGSLGAAIRIIRVGAWAFIVARCDVDIDIGPIHIHCTMTVVGWATVLATAPNPTIVSFTLVANLWFSCLVQV
ncbi:MAG TPA: hypothetical protein VFA94_09410 [Acidimicrobiales bacterium]|nr:hypothetical protein [Acidimicrobiales bacterium]